MFVLIVSVDLVPVIMRTTSLNSSICSIAYRTRRLSPTQLPLLPSQLRDMLAFVDSFTNVQHVSQKGNQEDNRRIGTDGMSPREQIVQIPVPNISLNLDVVSLQIDS